MDEPFGNINKFTKRKLGGWQILKFESSRLKRRNYKVQITLEEARLNSEVIKLAENELISAIQRIQGRQTDFSRVEELTRSQREISRRKNSDTNRKLLLDIRKEIDGLTFVPELIAIKFSDKRHYQNIRDNGIFINDKEYVRILAGAGNIRRNTVLFILKEMYNPLMEILNCGRNINVPLNPAKFNAYLGLYSSSGHRVSTPRFAVIPDYALKRMAKLNWIDKDDKVSVQEREIELNVFDGQGLISPELSEQWAKELGLSYIPSAFTIRAPFAKGQVVTFDYKEFARDSGVNIGRDLWGNEFVIEDVDLVLSESQFKLWDSYTSLQEHIHAMRERGLSFRIPRYAPKELREDSSTNYMFLQVLEPNDDDIDELISDTVDYFKNIRLEDNRITSLYLSGGNTFDAEFGEDDFADLDIITKAVLSYPPLLHERYVSQRIRSTLQKKEKEARLGKLVTRGNYSVLASDPYAQAQWLCGLEVTGLLGEDEHYSFFWESRGIDKVASARSPLTHNSEMRESKIVSGWKMDKWYKYLDTVFILPISGLDTLYYADAD